jgi:hypothetical protein
MLVPEEEDGMGGSTCAIAGGKSSPVDRVFLGRVWGLEERHTVETTQMKEGRIPSNV